MEWLRALALATVKQAARKRPRVLPRLLEAKRQSDRRNYGAKHSILRELIHQHPKAFKVDSERHGVVGLTHKPTGFRIHMPRRALPTLLQRAHSKGG